MRPCGCLLGYERRRMIRGMYVNVSKIALATLIVATCSVARAEPPSIANLSWLSGCWAREQGEPGSGEMWTAPAGGTMLGISRTIRAGKTVEHEFMQIREGGPWPDRPDCAALGAGRDALCPGAIRT